MQIRIEEPADVGFVREVHRQAFDDHGEVVADLSDALRDSIGLDRGLSLVAEDDGRIVGNVMFTHSWLDAPRRLVDVEVLSPVGVLPERQRQGIGSALIRHGLQLLTERSVPLVFLEGVPDYYPRFGFRPGVELGFGKPSVRIPDAAFQAIRLPAYESWMTGALIYSETFWRHDAVGIRDPDA